MALIVCENCGKKISDTTEKCIHCGALLKTLENKADDVNRIKEETAKEEKTRVNYLTLSDSEQMRLEEEFWEYDKEAFEWYVKMYQNRKPLDIPFFLETLGGLLVGVPVGIILKAILSGSAREFAMFGLMVSSFAVFVGYFSMSFGILFNSGAKKRRKQFIYQKRFQRWLKENKDMDFMPTLWKKGDELLFESVDIDKETF